MSSEVKLNDEVKRFHLVPGGTTFQYPVTIPFTNLQ